MGGYATDIRAGMEDWDFWLRCAEQDHWGTTIPEFFDWYRRRETHGDRWADLKSRETMAAFRDRLQERFAATARRTAIPAAT